MTEFVGWVNWVCLPTEPMKMLKYGVQDKPFCTPYACYAYMPYKASWMGFTAYRLT